MARVSLELVDSGLIFVSSRGRVSAASPGLAIIDGHDLLVGLDAAGSARLKPRRLHSRFWENLSDAPLAKPFPAHLRSADLAHAHLQSLWKAEGGGVDEVVIAVPSLYSEKQLGLLLGIAKASGMPVRGLVDAAVAATADRPAKSRCLHLDLHLHRAVLTELDRETDIERGAVTEDSRIGLLGLYDVWARAIAKIFVQTTRFDPFHQAASEQSLYVRLHHSLAALTEKETTTLSISSGGRNHSVDLEVEDVVDAALPAYESLARWVRDRTEPSETTLLVSDRLAGLPGLTAHLRNNTDAEIIALHPAAAASGALAHGDRICTNDEALPFVTQLPAYDSRPASDTVAVTPPSGAGDRPEFPTHVVLGGVAHRITDDGIVIGNLAGEPGGPDHQVTIRRTERQVVLDAPRDGSVMVNDKPVGEAAALETGDQVRLGPSEDAALLVTMVE